MNGPVRAENRCNLSSNIYSVVCIDRARFSSCLENEGYADENRRLPSAHYERLPLEDLEEQQVVVSNPVAGGSSSLLSKNALSQKNVLTNSSVLYHYENGVCDFPDPFPELSLGRLAPASAQMYGPETNSLTLNTLEQPQVAAGDRVDFPPATDCGFDSRTVDAGSSSSHSSLDKLTVDIYVSAKNVYSVEIDDTMTVAGVCDHIDEITHSKRDPFWTIVEHLDKFNIERSLEDHELLITIVRSWHSDRNRLIFRKDFCRYELYSNPNQCFPERMLDVKLPKEDSKSFMTRNELYRNLLLKCLLANQCMPDIQGYLHMRDGKKGWKKYFCVLRHSGLYYITKGCIKDSQRMVLLSDLTNDNIYVALNSKKAFGSPTQHSFCLAPSDDPNDKHRLRQFCTEDEQSRICWITGMRFIKFGAQLHENCRTFVSRNSARKENTATDRSNRQSNYCPQIQKSVSRISESSSVDTLTSILQTSVSFNSDSDPQNLEWFHDSIGREEAVSLLCNSGLKEGTFLVRHSRTLSGVYVLSFVHSGIVKHCMIHKIKFDDGCWYYSLDGGSTKFMDLVQLIDFYRLNAGRLPTRLVCHVTRSF